MYIIRNLRSDKVYNTRVGWCDIPTLFSDEDTRNFHLPEYGRWEKVESEKPSSDCIIVKRDRGLTLLTIGNESVFLTDKEVVRLLKDLVESLNQKYD